MPSGYSISTAGSCQPTRTARNTQSLLKCWQKRLSAWNAALVFKTYRRCLNGDIWRFLWRNKTTVMATPEESQNDSTEAEAGEPTLLPLLTHLTETERTTHFSGWSTISETSANAATINWTFQAKRYCPVREIWLVDIVFREHTIENTIFKIKKQEKD